MKIKNALSPEIIACSVQLFFQDADANFSTTANLKFRRSCLARCPGGKDITKQDDLTAGGDERSGSHDTPNRPPPPLLVFAPRRNELFSILLALLFITQMRRVLLPNVASKCIFLPFCVPRETLVYFCNCGGYESASLVQ